MSPDKILAIIFVFTYVGMGLATIALVRGRPGLSAVVCGALLLVFIFFHSFLAYGGVPPQIGPKAKPKEPELRQQSVPTHVSEAYCGLDEQHRGCCFMLLNGNGYFMCEGDADAKMLRNLRLINKEDMKP